MFPEKKGLITGVLNLTFGGSSAIMSPIYSYFLVSEGYHFTCGFAAVISLLLGTSVALFIRIPGEKKDQESQLISTLSLKKILSLPQFWFLWFVWAMAGAAGVSLIVLSASFGRYLGYGIVQSVYILTCFNLLNGVGRLVCGRLADTYSKQYILMTVFLLAAAAYAVMPFFNQLWMVSFLACFVGLAFGVMFSVSAPLVTEVFGLENFGIIFGLVFTAYGFFAGCLGPWLSGVILDITDSNYQIVFIMFAVFYLISSVLILKVKKGSDVNS
jgi:OFA family oxalate/formate antiporter-like MFS transporter